MRHGTHTRFMNLAGAAAGACVGNCVGNPVGAIVAARVAAHVARDTASVTAPVTTLGTTTSMSTLTPHSPGILAADQASFVAAFGPVVERSPWVVQRAWAQGPFGTLAEVYGALIASIRAATVDEQLALLRAHPELAGHEALAGSMTAESNSEQARLGLFALSTEQYARLTGLNRRYSARFGFPMIVALRLHDDLESVLRHAEARLANDVVTERGVALDQIAEVIRGRLFGAPAGGRGA